MSQRRRGASGPQLATFALGFFLTHAVGAHAQVVLPSDFQQTVALSGLTLPTAVKFARDGRVFVAEKSGLIKVFDSLADPTPDVFADLRTEVHNFWDRGMLGLELHPQFPDVPYVYVLYTLDRLPRSAWIDPNPNDDIVDPPIPQWGSVGGTSDGCPTPPGATGSGCPVTGRLSRLTAVGNVAGPEVPLIEDWCQQFPSHSIGDLAFGSDGALYVSGGDGASFNYADYGQSGGTGGVPVNVCGDPPVPAGSAQAATTSQGGALRSQNLRRPDGPAVLDGTILRVDPETGDAMPDNPLSHSLDPLARRIVAYGMRNPFRITERPGTSEIWIADVGWNTWEEINRVTSPTTGVVNFGWPCYEGAARQSGYDGLNNTQCENLYNGVLAPSIDPIAAGTLASPFYAYNHNADVVSGDVCPPNPTGQVSSSLGGLAFYQGGPYPGNYNGALFFADYSRDCVWAMMPGANGTPNPASRITFVGRASNPVALEIGPNGDLFYVDFDGGAIRRITYVGQNHAPVAALTADPTSGSAPLTVQLSTVGSTDADNDPLTYAWDLDNDGQFDDATTITTSRTFAANGSYTVRVRVTDDAGASDTKSVSINVGSGGSLPSGWFNTDIGATGVAGSASWNSGAFTVRGSGADIWYAADAFHFVYQPLAWNGEIRARVASLSNPNPWAKAGVMIRESLTPGSPHAMVALTPGNGVAFQRRTSANIDSLHTAGPVVTAPYWVRLVRAGNTFTGYASPDGVTWTPVGSTTIAMPANVYVGLPVTSHNNGVLATAVFDQVVVGTPPPPSAPTATIASPAAGLTWKVGDVIAFSGSATDPQDGTLTGDALTWTLVINHCPNNDCHQHVVQSWNGTSGSFTAPDHEYPSSLELRLVAVDSSGLSDTKSVVLQPQTVSLTVTSAPAGMTVGFNATSAAAPVVRTVIVGSSNSITAPSPQTVGGNTYTFQSWSDGGAAAHNVIAPATATTYTATFTGSGGGGSLPSGWLNTDIGATGVAGAASWTGGTFTLSGSGADIWYFADAFHFAYQQVAGNASIVARVDSLQNTNAWAKAGVMIRESLAPNARNVLMAITPSSGTGFQRRTGTGGETQYTAGPAAAAPYWVRVVRSGETFTASASTDGTSWTTVGTVTIGMASTAYAGLVLTSHDNAVAGTAMFTQVTVVP